MNKKQGLFVYDVSLEQDLSYTQFEKLLKFVDIKKAQQLQRMKIEKAKASLAGILLAKYAIRKKWGIPLKNIHFEEGFHGKPYMIGHEQIYFNISHSEDICVCAVDDTPVGIDIQKMDDRNFEKIADRFFTVEEKALYEQEGSDKLAFYRMWTKREAVGKYLGVGFYYKKDDDTADWQVEYKIIKNEYMRCICKQKVNYT